MRVAMPLLVLLLALNVPAAIAGLTPERCVSKKLDLATKLASCRVSAEARASKMATTPIFTKCDETFTSSWQHLEQTDQTSVCPTSGDSTVIFDAVTGHTDGLALRFSGGLASPDCSTIQSSATGQLVSYGAGDDGEQRKGATLAFADNGDGTIIDLQTGLMWEKKFSIPQTGYPALCDSEAVQYCSNPHNVNAAYRWTSASPSYNGPVVTIFLAQLNDRCDKDPSVACSINADCNVSGGSCGFAGYRDWRLPNIQELAGIIDYGRPGPAVDPLFDTPACAANCSDITSADCSCNSSETNWSSSTKGTILAWTVRTWDGAVESSGKSSFAHARAVRGGL